jgi:hypothetical protein
MVGSTYIRGDIPLLRQVYQVKEEVLISKLKTGKITDYCKTYYGINNT